MGVNSCIAANAGCIAAKAGCKAALQREANSKKSAQGQLDRRPTQDSFGVTVEGQPSTQTAAFNCRPTCSRALKSQKTVSSLLTTGHTGNLSLQQGKDSIVLKKEFKEQAGDTSGIRTLTAQSLPIGAHLASSCLA